MAILSADEVLWSEFEDELDALIEATNAADKSYVEGRGMSLASVAVGSAATRLRKVMRDESGREWGWQLYEVPGIHVYQVGNNAVHYFVDAVQDSTW